MAEIRDTWEGLEVFGVETDATLITTWQGLEVFYLEAAQTPSIFDTWHGLEVFYFKATASEPADIACGVASAFKGGVRRAKGHSA